MSLPSTQKSIDIAGIKDGVVIMKNGEYRIILSVASVNFALKSEEEKNAIVFQFQNFLNSLHFPLQIVIRSKRVDLAPYLEKMKVLAQKQPNELIQAQTNEYIDFVTRLIEVANIMKKAFYVVIGEQALMASSKNFLESFFKKNDPETLRIAEESYKKKIDGLKQRANAVAYGLSQIGLRTKQLSSEEIIGFFYQSYNPDLAEKQRLKDIQSTLESNKPGVPETSPVEEHVQEIKKPEDIFKQDISINPGVSPIPTPIAESGVSSQPPTDQANVQPISDHPSPVPSTPNIPPAPLGSAPEVTRVPIVNDLPIGGDSSMPSQNNAPPAINPQNTQK